MDEGVAKARLGRSLSRMTENLKPAAFLPVDDALGCVDEILRACFLPASVVIENDRNEYGFFVTAASVLGYRVRTGGRDRLDTPAIRRLFNAAIRGYDALEAAQVEAWKVSLGLPPSFEVGGPDEGVLDG